MTAISLPKLDIPTATTMELEEQEPWPPERTKGNRAIGKRSRDIWSNADQTLWTGVWECDEGTFWANFGGYGEAIHVLAGEMECISDADGSVITLKSGDVTVFPRGWTGWWLIKRRVRKLYSAWQYE